MRQSTTDESKKCPQFYKIGDKVEAIKLNIGAWFSADIIDIYPKTNCECFIKCQCIFKILFESENENAEIAERKLDEVRQVTYSSLEWNSLKKGMKVVINYNVNNPGLWGYWYDYLIENVWKRNEVTYVKGTLLVGYEGVSDKIPVEINSDSVSDILEIRPHATVNEKELETYETGVKPEFCKNCKNKPKTKCRKCCCCKCGIKKDFNLTVLCDECADWYHIYCIKPPLNALPDDDDDWYCPKCSNETLHGKKESGLKQQVAKQQRKIKRACKKENANANKETNLGSTRQLENKVKDVSREDIPLKKIKSEIPKNSSIWNDVEKFFPKYEVIHIYVELIDKNEDKDHFVPNPALQRAIYGDEINEHLWNEAREKLKDGKEAFIACVRRLFTCSICCDLMKEPITLSCKHSFCITCFFKALSVNVYNCALCRTDVIHTEHYLVNENLTKALELIFER